jgi:hypothetical protein
MRYKNGHGHNLRLMWAERTRAGDERQIGPPQKSPSSPGPTQSPTQRRHAYLAVHRNERLDTTATSQTQTVRRRAPETSPPSVSLEQKPSSEDLRWRPTPPTPAPCSRASLSAPPGPPFHSKVRLLPLSTFGSREKCYSTIAKTLVLPPRFWPSRSLAGPAGDQGLGRVQGSRLREARVAGAGEAGGIGWVRPGGG